MLEVDKFKEFRDQSRAPDLEGRADLVQAITKAMIEGEVSISQYDYDWVPMSSDLVESIRTEMFEKGFAVWYVSTNVEYVGTLTSIEWKPLDEMWPIGYWFYRLFYLTSSSSKIYPEGVKDA